MICIVLSHNRSCMSKNCLNVSHICHVSKVGRTEVSERIEIYIAFFSFFFRNSNLVQSVKESVIIILRQERIIIICFRPEHKAFLIRIRAALRLCKESYNNIMSNRNFANQVSFRTLQKSCTVPAVSDSNQVIIKINIANLKPLISPGLKPLKADKLNARYITSLFQSSS